MNGQGFYRDNDPKVTGQSFLIDEAPCDCDPAKTNLYIRNMTMMAHGTGQHLSLCVIARAVSLSLVAAAFVNPLNVEPEGRDDCKRAALRVAEMMEQIARGIRRRAGDA